MPYTVSTIYGESDAVHFAEHHWPCNNIERIHGIPLTSEILREAGFEVKDDNPKEKPHYEGDVLVMIAGFEFSNSMKDGFYSYEINEGKTVLRYVHQLQNLYFALTGTELDVTL